MPESSGVELNTRALFAVAGCVVVSAEASISGIPVSSVVPIAPVPPVGPVDPVMPVSAGSVGSVGPSRLLCLLDQSA